MLEVTGSFAVELLYMLHAQLFKQLRQDDAAHRVHAVDGHVEVGLADSLYIHQGECQHAVDMLLVVAQVLAVAAQLIHFGVGELFGFGDAEHFVALLLVEEFAMLVQQFQGVPLTGIMRGGQDDTTTSTLHHHSQFCGRRRGQVDIYHVPAHTHQGTYYDVLHHLA